MILLPSVLKCATFCKCRQFDSNVNMSLDIGSTLMSRSHTRQTKYAFNDMNDNSRLVDGAISRHYGIGNGTLNESICHCDNSRAHVRTISGIGCSVFWM